MKIEHNEQNCEELAMRVVDAWDMEGLVDFARETLRAQYLRDSEQFAHDAAEFLRADDTDEDDDEE